MFKKTIQDAWNRRLLASQSESFVADMVTEIQNTKNVRAIRIHDTGDFYDQKYLNKWIAIASQLPNVTFYAYTKSLFLDFSDRPSNMLIIGSEGGMMDSDLLKLKVLKKIDSIAKVFESDTDLYQSDRVYVNCYEHDTLAILTAEKQGFIGLVKH
jgi:hypothetical protein